MKTKTKKKGKKVKKRFEITKLLQMLELDNIQNLWVKNSPMLKGFSSVHVKCPLLISFSRLQVPVQIGTTPAIANNLIQQMKEENVCFHYFSEA